MHEASLMKGLMSRIDEMASSQGARRITAVRVKLGALSHFTEDHFREHFEEASHGTRAFGATLETTLDSDIAAPDAQHVILESIDVETD